LGTQKLLYNLGLSLLVLTLENLCRLQCIAVLR